MYTFPQHCMDKGYWGMRLQWCRDANLRQELRLVAARNIFLRMDVFCLHRRGIYDLKVSRISGRKVNVAQLTDNI